MAYICIRNQEILHVRNDKHEQIAAFIAKIAQLVEHDLAKVGVAGSSPVFRSKRAIVYRSHSCPDGGMVDTKDLKSFGFYGCAGSSPAPGTQRDN